MWVVLLGAEVAQNECSSTTAPPAHDKDAHQQYVEAEERLQQIGHTISPGGCPDTPLHITKFDDSYMRDSHDVFELRAPQDTVAHLVIDYSKSWKGTEEAREMDPNATRKVMGVDYRFWNVFHSNLYATTILTARKCKICKMQYIYFDDLQEKEEPEFNTAIRICDRFELTAIMSFKHDWNVEILAQFHATYF
jgi:hypothetical protein